jgi:hypothetical protein
MIAMYAMFHILNASQEVEPDGQHMLHHIFLGNIDHCGFFPIKGPFYQEPLQDTIPPHPRISTLIKSTGHLDMYQEPKAAEVEIIAQMIKPGVTGIMGINASGDVTNGGIRAGAKMSRPSGTQLSLGTRGLLPNGYILITLGSQVLSDKNGAF